MRANRISPYHASGLHVVSFSPVVPLLHVSVSLPAPCLTRFDTAAKGLHTSARYVERSIGHFASTGSSPSVVKLLQP